MAGLQHESSVGPPLASGLKFQESELFRLKEDESLFRVMMRTAWVGFLGAMANGLESMRERAANGREIYHPDE